MPAFRLVFQRKETMRADTNWCLCSGIRPFPDKVLSCRLTNEVQTEAWKVLCKHFQNLDFVKCTAFLCCKALFIIVLKTLQQINRKTKTVLGILMFFGWGARINYCHPTHRSWFLFLGFQDSPIPGFRSNKKDREGFCMKLPAGQKDSVFRRCAGTDDTGPAGITEMNQTQPSPRW